VATFGDSERCSSGRFGIFIFGGVKYPHPKFSGHASSTYRASRSRLWRRLHLSCDGRNLIHHVDNSPVLELGSPRIIKRKQPERLLRLTRPGNADHTHLQQGKMNLIRKRKWRSQYEPPWHSTLQEHTPIASRCMRFRQGLRPLVLCLLRR
jgi:hypothetical protein